MPAPIAEHAESTSHRQAAKRLDELRGRHYKGGEATLKLRLYVRALRLTTRGLFVLQRQRMFSYSWRASLVR